MTKHHHKANHEVHDPSKVNEQIDAAIPGPSKFASTAVSILNLLVVPGFLFLGFLASKYILKAEFEKIDHSLIRKVTSRYPSDWSFEGRVEFLISAFYVVALFLLGNVLIVSLLRGLSGKIYPFAEGDNLLINTFNRVIQNTIEQSFIFFPLFSHYVLTVSTEKDSKTAFLYVLVFIVGRLIFLGGYLFNLITKIVGLRVSGFAMNVIVNILLVVKFIGCPHFEKFVTGFLA